MVNLTERESATHLVTSILHAVADGAPSDRSLGTDDLERELGAHNGLTKRLVTMLVGAGYLQSTPISNWQARNDHVDIELTLHGLEALGRTEPPPTTWNARTAMYDAASVGTLASLAFQIWRAAIAG